jgi:branched-chain amino acid aminotransferase
VLKKYAIVLDAIDPSLSSSALHVSSHTYAEDARNPNVLVLIRDGLDKSVRLTVRAQANVSVFESGFLMGDGVWEGLRVHKGCVLFLEDHLERLYEGALALDMTMDLTRDEMEGLVYECLDANGVNQDDQVHLRLCVSRGVKSTPYQSPYPPTQLGFPTVVIIPEYKSPSKEVLSHGLRLFTVHVTRGHPTAQDPGLNSHSKGNCIQACIQAHHAGADEALMLDPHGFVATCNSTNFFIIRQDELWCPRPQYQMPGITRSKAILVARRVGITVKEIDISLRQVYSADEAFTTGTFGGLQPVKSVDGRRIGHKEATLPGAVTRKLMEAYSQLKDEYVF